jgi:exosome complex RNA-binding protein Rrp42 (RNase PH superfamily)
MPSNPSGEASLRPGAVVVVVGAVVVVVVSTVEEVVLDSDGGVVAAATGGFLSSLQAVSVRVATAMGTTSLNTSQKVRRTRRSRS